MRMRKTGFLGVQYSPLRDWVIEGDYVARWGDICIRSSTAIALPET